MLLALVSFQSQAVAQTVRASVDCRSGRLGAAERETCASPDLVRLTARVDSLTARLERTLGSRDREALVDTEGPFARQRNDCANRAGDVRQCVERLLRHRLAALAAAATSPATILSETAQYAFLDVPYFARWGSVLVGRRVSVWGRLTLDPGPTPASRIHGAIHAGPAAPGAPYVPVNFKTLTETRARWFYDAKQPVGYWTGTVERLDGRLVLAEMEP